MGDSFNLDKVLDKLLLTTEDKQKEQKEQKKWDLFYKEINDTFKKETEHAKRKIVKSEVSEEIKKRIKNNFDEIEKQMKWRREQNNLSIAYGASACAIESIKRNHYHMDIEETRLKKAIEDKYNGEYQVKKELYIAFLNQRINHSIMKSITKKQNTDSTAILNQKDKELRRITEAFNYNYRYGQKGFTGGNMYHKQNYANQRKELDQKYNDILNHIPEPYIDREALFKEQQIKGLYENELRKVYEMNPKEIFDNLA